MLKRSLRVLFLSRKPTRADQITEALLPLFEPLSFRRIASVNTLLATLKARKYDLLVVDSELDGLDMNPCSGAKPEDCPPSMLLVDSLGMDARIQATRLGCNGIIAASDFGSNELQILVSNVVGSGKRLVEEREQHSRFEQIFELIGEGVGIIDARGKVLMANPAVARLVETPRDKLIGMSISRFLDISSQKRVLRELPLRRQGIEGGYDVSLRHPKGRTLRVFATPLLDKRGRFQGAVLVGHDVTEDRLRERLWSEREEQYRTLVRQLPRAAFMMFDKQLSYTLAEGELLKQSGIDAERLVGQKVGASKMPNVEQLLKGRFKEALEGKSSSYKTEVIDRFYQIRVNPVYNRLGEIEGGAVLIIEVSAETRAERSLHAQYELGKVLNQSNSVNEIVADWLTSVAKITSIQQGVVYRWSEDSQSYRLVESLGLTKAQIKKLGELDKSHPIAKLAAKGALRFKFPPKAEASVSEILGKRTKYLPEVLLPAFIDDRQELALLMLGPETRTVSEQIREQLATSRDLVEQFLQRIHSQSERQRLAAYLRNIADSQADMIVRVDPEGRFTFVNDAYVRTFGKPREELLGSKFSPLVHQDDIEATLAAMEKLSDPPHRVTIEQRAQTVDGWRWLQWEDSAVLDDEGNIIEIQGVGRDITDSKLAQEEVRKSREQLSLIIEGAQLGTWDINLKTGIATRNRRWAEMLGYDPDEISPTFDAWDELMHPEDLPRARQVVADHLAGKSEFTLIEHRLLTKSGEWKWIQSWGRVVEWDEDGTPLRAAGTHFDIDERKKIDEDLRYSEMKLAEAQRIAKIGNWDWDLRDQTIFWSEETYRILGYEPGEIKASLRALLDRINEEDRDRVQSILEQAVAKKQSYRVEFSLHPSEKEEKIATIVGELQYDEFDDPVRMVGTLQDITQQRLAERALRESEAMLEEAQRIAHLGHWSWNLKNNDVELSDEAFRILGYRPNEVEPTYEYFVSHIHDEDREYVRGLIENATASASGDFSFEHRVLTKNGSVRSVQEQGRVIRNEEGVPLRLIGTVQDITDRKIAEQALRESEERLERVVRGANLGTWYWNIETGQDIVNEQWAKMVGRKMSELSFDFDMWRESIHPDDLNRVLDVLSDHLEGRTDIYEAEYRMMRSDGTPFWIRDRGSVVSRDSTGKPLRMAGTVIDIDARKRAEEAVRESEERFRTMWDTMVDGIITITTEGIIQGMNPASETIFGWKNEEIIGKNVTVLMPEPYTSEHDEYIRSYREEGVRNIIGVGREVVGLHKSGNTFPMDLAVNEMILGDTVYLTGIVRDITERKLISAQLRESEERYRMLAEHSTDLISKLDPAGTFTYVSPASSMMLGYDPEELIGESSIELVHREDIKRVARQFDVILAGDASDISTLSYRVRRKDGEYIWLETTSRSIRTASGMLVEIIAMSRDVTERKRSEAQLREASEELRKAYEETARAYRAAEQANEAKSEFLASMSHEIRTPMTAILGFSKILRDKVEDEEPKKWVGNMISSGEHLLDLINDVLDISRVEAGRMRLNPEPLDLARLSEEIFQLFQPLANEKSLDLSLEISDLPPRLLLDRQRIRQVITNFLGNAVKFTEEGSVSFTVRGDADESKIYIEVKDTGPGIPDDVQPKVFEPFYQVERAGQDSSTGTGLGLAITMRLVQQMGGTIELDSGLGKGSRFEAAIPCEFLDSDDTELPEAKKQSRTEVLSSEPLSILVADDHEPNRMLIEHILTSHGHDVVMVTNGREAVEAFQERAFDRVVLDVQMPVMGGFEAIQHIRTVPGGDRVPIMTLTAYAMRGDKLKSLEQGADGYLAKPFDPDELLEHVVGLTRRTGMAVIAEDPAEASGEDLKGEPPEEDPTLVELKRLYLESVVREVAEQKQVGELTDEVKRWAHRIAGSGGSFGYPELTRIGREIEHAEVMAPEELMSKLGAIEELVLEELERLGK